MADKSEKQILEETNDELYVHHRFVIDKGKESR